MYVANVRLISAFVMGEISFARKRESFSYQFDVVTGIMKIYIDDLA